MRGWGLSVWHCWNSASVRGLWGFVCSEGDGGEIGDCWGRMRSRLCLERPSSGRCRGSRRLRYIWVENENRDVMRMCGATIMTVNERAVMRWCETRVYPRCPISVPPPILNVQRPPASLFELLDPGKRSWKPERLRQRAL